MGSAPLHRNTRSLMRSTIHRNESQSHQSAGISTSKTTRFRCLSKSGETHLKKSQMTSLRTSRELHDLSVEAGFIDAFARADPYSDAYSQQINKELDLAAKQLWQSVRDAFSASEGISYRNAWVLAQGDNFLCAALFRIASALFSPNSDVVVFQSHIARTRFNLNLLAPWLRQIADRNYIGIPLLNIDERHKPGLQIRYALARESLNNFNVNDCLAISWPISCRSQWVWIREFKRAIEHTTRYGKLIQQLTKKELKALSLTQLRFLSADKGIFEKCVDVDDAAREQLKLKINQMWCSRESDRKKLSRILKACRFATEAKWSRRVPRLYPGNIENFSMTLNREQVLSVESDLAKQYAPRFLSWLATPRHIEHLWQPFSPEALRFLQRLCSKKTVPNYLGWSAEEITNAIVTKKLRPNRLSNTEIQLIRKTWREKDEDRLLKSGYGYILGSISSNLVDDNFRQICLAANIESAKGARDTICGVLEKHELKDKVIEFCLIPKFRYLRTTIATYIAAGDKEWIESLSPHFGNRSLAIIFSDIDVAVCAQLHDMLVKRPLQIISRTEYLSCLANALVTIAVESKNSEGLVLANELFENFSAELSLINLKISNKKILRIVLNTSVRGALRKILEDMYENTSDLKKLDKRIVSQLKTPGELYRFIANCPRALRAVFENTVRPNQRIRLNEDIAGYILCYRRSSELLKSLARRCGSDRFNAACHLAEKLLPGNSRDRGYLELVRQLGTRNIRLLAAVMAMASNAAPAGYKLDKSYRRYKLPKKAGGHRIISVPHPILKRVQRAMLSTLLNELPPHPSVHGFVKERSIVTNARNHVGKRVVANCDIANCFPTVKWSIVLGSLRRDFDHRLSPAAISLLADICTSNGGLAIGAPTSPALLNRVLHRSDQIIDKKAKTLGCEYSRYADDLTFSGDSRAVKMIGYSERILSQIGLKLDAKKTNIFRRGRRQVVTGLVVNDKVGLPRRIRRKIRAAVHSVELGKPPTWHEVQEPISSLEGRLKYMLPINPDSALRLLQRLRSAKK